MTGKARKRERERAQVKMCVNIVSEWIGKKNAKNPPTQLNHGPSGYILLLLFSIFVCAWNWRVYHRICARVCLCNTYDSGGDFRLCLDGTLLHVFHRLDKFVTCACADCVCITMSTDQAYFHRYINIFRCRNQTETSAVRPIPSSNRSTQQTHKERVHKFAVRLLQCTHTVPKYPPHTKLMTLIATIRMQNLAGYP